MSSREIRTHIYILLQALLHTMNYLIMIGHQLVMWFHFQATTISPVDLLVFLEPKMRCTSSSICNAHSLFQIPIAAVDAVDAVDAVLMLIPITACPKWRSGGVQLPRDERSNVEAEVCERGLVGPLFAPEQLRIAN